MATRSPNWSIEETTLALSLYVVTPYSRIRADNPQIMALAKLIGRRPGAVSFKLANLASFDGKAKGKGFDHTSKNDSLVWNHYFDGRELSLPSLMDDAVTIAKKLPNPDLSLTDWLDPQSNEAPLSPSLLSQETLTDLLVTPEFSDEIKVIRTQRRSQGIFRQAVLANFNGACAVTGCCIPSLIEAAHILPWADHPCERLKLSNGLALNPFLHAAYDDNLLGIDADGKIFVSDALLSNKGGNEKMLRHLREINGTEVDFSKLRVQPNKDYLDDRFQTYRSFQLSR